MKPIKLIISAIGPYAGTMEPIEFTEFEEKGLFLISGDTGAGKTTIFDAICYALFDKTSGTYRDTKNLRSEYAAESTESFVDFTFSHQGKEYRVYRQPEYERKKQRGEGTVTQKEKATLYENGVAIEDGIKPVNKRLEELLDVSVNQFKQIAMIAQGEFYELLNAKTDERTKILRSIFLTDAYNAIEFKLQDRMKEAVGERMNAENSIRQYFMEAKATEDTEESEELQQYQDRISNTKSIWDIAEMENLLQKLINRDQEEVKPVQKLTEEAEQEEKKRHTAVEQADEQNKKLRERDQLRVEKANLDDKKTDISQKKEKLSRQKDATRSVEPARKSAEEKKKHYDGIQQKIASVTTKKAEVLEQLKSIQKVYEAAQEKQGDLRKLILQMETIQKDKPQYEKKDRLEKDYAKAKTACASAISQYDSIHHAKDEAERILNANRAGLLAQLLEDGMPCPVCGSTEHPHPMTLQDCDVTEDDYEDLKKQEEKALKTRDEAVQKAEALRADVEQIQKLPYESWKDAEKVWKDLDAQRKALDAEIQKATNDKNEIENAISDIVGQEKALVEEEKKAKENTEASEKELTELLSIYKFESIEEMQSFVVTEKYITSIEEEISKYETSVALNQAALEKAEQETAGLEVVDVTELKTRLQEQTVKKRMLQERLNEIRNRIHQNTDLLGSIHRQKDAYEKAKHDSNLYSRLYNLVKGKSGNGSKITLEQYIQAAGFDGIIRAANRRLAPMSDGQYELFRQESATDNRSNTFLDLEVLDNYTGHRRPVGSLSGGESFKASLSLALGLSDTVSSNLGGVQMDALFIDEGFGTLDRKSIDNAMETLINLSGKNKLVGIISHREELVENIPQQIHVTKERDGSHYDVVKG